MIDWIPAVREGSARAHDGDDKAGRTCMEGRAGKGRLAGRAGSQGRLQGARAGLQGQTETGQRGSSDSGTQTKPTTN